MERLKEKVRKKTFIHLSNIYSVTNIGCATHNNGNSEKKRYSLYPISDLSRILKRYTGPDHQFMFHLKMFS